MSQVIVARIRDLIGDDELEAAIDGIFELARAVGGRLDDEAVALRGRANRLARQARQGLMTAAEVDAARNRLSADALALLAELARTQPAAPPTYDPQVDLTDIDVSLEKLFGSSRLRHLAWLRQGLDAARPVCRVITEGWKGTGFMISGRRMITNSLLFFSWSGSVVVSGGRRVYPREVVDV